VLDTIQSLKFSFDWEIKSHVRGGKNWKTQYKKVVFEELFSAEIAQIQDRFGGSACTGRINRLYSRFRNSHEKIITSRNQLRKLYLSVRLTYRGFVVY
jgi:hypothetical protein